jgi:CLIP-associating protein 1/2
VISFIEIYNNDQHALSPKDMDGFLPLLATTDTRIKLTVAMNLVNYLGDPNNSIKCSDIGQFIGGLVAWVQSSNNKLRSLCDQETKY